MTAPSHCKINCNATQLFKTPADNKSMADTTLNPAIPTCPRGITDEADPLTTLKTVTGTDATGHDIIHTPTTDADAYDTFRGNNSPSGDPTQFTKSYDALCKIDTTYYVRSNVAQFLPDATNLTVPYLTQAIQETRAETVTAQADGALARARYIETHNIYVQVQETTSLVDVLLATPLLGHAIFGKGVPWSNAFVAKFALKSPKLRNIVELETRSNLVREKIIRQNLCPTDEIGKSIKKLPVTQEYLAATRPINLAVWTMYSIYGGAWLARVANRLIDTDVLKGADLRGILGEPQAETPLAPIPDATSGKSPEELLATLKDMLVSERAALLKINGATYNDKLHTAKLNNLLIAPDDAVHTAVTWGLGALGLGSLTLAFGPIASWAHNKFKASNNLSFDADRALQKMKTEQEALADAEIKWMKDNKLLAACEEETNSGSANTSESLMAKRNAELAERNISKTPKAQAEFVNPVVATYQAYGARDAANLRAQPQYDAAYHPTSADVGLGALGFLGMAFGVSELYCAVTGASAGAATVASTVAEEVILWKHAALALLGIGAADELTPSRDSAK